jgi:hypothetical protein
MKYSKYIPILSLLLNSCIGLGTLHPISDVEADFIFKEELIGTWGEDPKDSSRYFSAYTTAGNNGKFYTIKYFFYDVDREKTDSICISSRLAYLNKSYFLDCQLCKESINEDYEDMLIRKHFIVKINFTETGNVEMISPDDNEFIKLIDQKKIALNYILLNEDDYLMLDKPAILKKAILTSLKYPSVYKEKIIFQRLE